LYSHSAKALMTNSANHKYGFAFTRCDLELTGPYTYVQVGNTLLSEVSISIVSKKNL
jgi:hypothetical protein